MEIGMDLGLEHALGLGLELGLGLGLEPDLDLLHDLGDLNGGVHGLGGLADCAQLVLGGLDELDLELNVLLGDHV